MTSPTSLRQAAIAFAATAIANAQPNGLSYLDELYRLPKISAVAFSPTGSQILFVRESHVWSQDRESSLWLLDPVTGATRALTAGKQDRQPRWSSGGHEIAFLSDRSGHAELYIVSLKSAGERLIPLKGVAPDADLVPLEMTWSPDGRFMAVLTGPAPTNWRNVSEPKAAEPNGPAILVVAKNARPLAQAPGECGYLWVVELATQTLQTIPLPGLCLATYASSNGQSALAWSPNGVRLAFVARSIGVYGGNESNFDDVYWWDFAAHRIGKIQGQALAETAPAWSADSQLLAVMSQNGASSYEESTSLLIRNFADGSERKLAPELNRLDTGMPLQWLSQTREWIVAERDGMDKRLIAIDADTAKYRYLTPERRNIADYAVAGDARDLAVIVEDANTPREIYGGKLEHGGLALKKLTNFRARAPLGAAERMSWRSKDDRFAIEAIVIRPPHFDPRRRYPLLVELHGGPGGAWSNSFEDLNFFNLFPPHFFAAQGYIVMLPNTRGDDGYPDDYRAALRNAWGDEYAADVEPGIDLLIRRGGVDPQKLAIAGHSYGAYLTAVALTRTNRFKAALWSDGIVDLASHYYQEWPDFAEVYEHWFGDGEPGENPQYQIRSPIFQAKRITTPTLLRAGNLRYGHRTYGLLDQARQLYAALRSRDVPTSLIIHNYEGHGIVNPDTYRDYLQKNLRWLDFYVRGEGTDPYTQGF